MVYIKILSIELDNRFKVYRSGEHVTGKMYVNCRKEAKINKILIQLKGESFVERYLN